MKRILLLPLLLPLLPQPAAAQHVHPTTPRDTAHAAHGHAETAHATDAQSHSMLGILGIPQSREGSGTSWLPDVTPMHAVHGQAGSWSLMLHGQASSSTSTRAATAATASSAASTGSWGWRVVHSPAAR